jgi:hypothetical protein
MCQRIEAAGTTLGRRRRANVKTLLKPGKRGKYKILVMFWAGWDRDREEEIKVGDPIPERPQLVYWAGALEGTGNGNRHISYLPILIISHHVLSRTALAQPPASALVWLLALASRGSRSNEMVLSHEMASSPKKSKK